jgi:endo-alpha-1,4-polygalactosaminidase (GH114 family)
MSDFIDNTFDPYEMLQNLDQAQHHLARAMMEQQKLNQVLNNRIDNLLVIVQNQQQQIEIVWDRQNHTETTANK